MKSTFVYFDYVAKEVIRHSRAGRTSGDAAIGGAPFDFSAVEHWALRKSYLAHKEAPPTQIECRWGKEKTVNCSLRTLAFVYQGVADDKVGITTSMAQELEQAGHTPPAGITLLRLQAPAVIYYQPTVPHRAGRSPYCEISYPGFAASGMLWIHVTPDGLLVHYCQSEIDSTYSSHLLRVKDGRLAQLAAIYAQELSHLVSEGNTLLAFMKRLRRHFTDFPALLSNSSCPEVAAMQPDSDRLVSERLCGRTITYINLHLHDVLTWDVLSEIMDVSPFYLNRVFRQFTGMSLMRYVHSRRIEAAKQMLIDGLEGVSDIARLTGFASSASFSNSFKKQVGCAPSEFRRRMNDTPSGHL